MRQISQKKSNLISYIQEPDIHEKVQRQKDKMRYTCHPKLRNGVEAWGFQEQEGSQDIKTRYLAIRHLPCNTDAAT